MDGSVLVVEALRTGAVFAAEAEPNPAGLGAYEALLHGLRHLMRAHRDAPIVLERFLDAPHHSDYVLRHFLDVTGASDAKNTLFEAERVLLLARER